MQSTPYSFPQFEPLPSSRGRVLVATLFLPHTLSVQVPGAPLKPRSSTTAKSPTNSAISGDPVYWHIEPSSLGNIGLQNAVNSVTHRMNRRLWVGTLGTSTEGYSDEMKHRLQQKMLGEYDSVTVFVDDEEREGHYNEFCKQVLWKPFHYQLSDYPKSKAFEERAWRHYVSVNQKFANVIASIHQPGDVVWVNDYHLMLVPAMVRQLVPNAMIGFFLHIPFPSSEVFRCLHVRKQILEGMLGADLIGFQTYSFMRHFLMTCTRLLALESTPKGIQLDNTVVSVGIFPIGINLSTLNEKRNNPEVAEIITSLKLRYAGKSLIIGRDKNDSIKGVRQKMLSFEKFLSLHPEWLGRVVLIQVALSTTDSNENEANVTEVVARINRRFGTIEYSPVVYLHQDISFAHYLALLTIADACLITSLRDGMNLTSHEYVACQQEKKSPLVISEFAGTYGSFGAAIRVNPWDTREVADAIHEALTMSEEDKQYHWNELYNYITTTNTAQAWVDSFVNEVCKVHETLQQHIASSLPPLPFTMVEHEYANAGKRILFLDHDGTLAPIGSPMANNIYEVLITLAADPKNVVYLMSGRTKDSLEVFRNIPNVGLCAENGCFVKFANKTRWESMLPETDLSWKKKVLEVFEYYTDRTPGSFIEQKDCSVVWHYGLADLNFVSWQAAECQNHIEQSLSPTYPIHTLAKRKRVEVMPRNANKGIAIRKILGHHQNLLKRSNSKSKSHEYTQHQISSDSLQSGKDLFDFILAVGDDRADEYMFEYLAKLDTTAIDGPSELEELDAEMTIAPGSTIPVQEVKAIKAESVSGVSRSSSPARSQIPSASRIIITCTVGRKSSAAYWHVANLTFISKLLSGLIEIGKADGVEVDTLKIKKIGDRGKIGALVNSKPSDAPSTEDVDFQSSDEFVKVDKKAAIFEEPKSDVSSETVAQADSVPIAILKDEEEEDLTKTPTQSSVLNSKKSFGSFGTLSRKISLFRTKSKSPPPTARISGQPTEESASRIGKLNMRTATLVQWMFVKKNQS
ncbi:hypothetical protein HK098_000343 [Nowakowskiella sp. JEL0407]|nr:hypothetical protein HK098_000343 [Nowakowskiella sp. JEL0407]